MENILFNISLFFTLLTMVIDLFDINIYKIKGLSITLLFASWSSWLLWPLMKYWISLVIILIILAYYYYNHVYLKSIKTPTEILEEFQAPVNTNDFPYLGITGNVITIMGNNNYLGEGIFNGVKSQVVFRSEDKLEVNDEFILTGMKGYDILGEKVKEEETK